MRALTISMCCRMNGFGRITNLRTVEHAASAPPSARRCPPPDGRPDCAGRHGPVQRATVQRARTKQGPPKSGAAQRLPSARPRARSVGA
jgi:hypothetical protein